MEFAYLLIIREKMRRWSLYCLLLSAYFLAACAPVKKEPDLVWPLPPDEPRIKFLYSFSSMEELGRIGYSAFKDILLGKDVIQGFRKPYAVHVDKEGNIYVTDTGFSRVQIFDRKKKAVLTLGGGRSILRKPVGVAVDSEGKIYVADSSHESILVFGKDGEFLSTIGKKGDLIRPVAVVLNDAIKRLYVVDNRKHQIVVFDLNSGDRLFDIGKRGNEKGDFNFPNFITIDSNGRLYIGDLQGRVQILDQDGGLIRYFGKLGDAPGMFARPKGIALDSEGHIYVVDAAFNNVQIFDSEGEVLTFFGEGGEGRGQMVLGAGVAIDSEDRVYVVDQWNARVNVYQYMGEKYKASQKK